MRSQHPGASPLGVFYLFLLVEPLLGPPNAGKQFHVNHKMLYPFSDGEEYRNEQNLPYALAKRTKADTILHLVEIIAFQGFIQLWLYRKRCVWPRRLHKDTYAPTNSLLDYIFSTRSLRRFHTRPPAR